MVEAKEERGWEVVGTEGEGREGEGREGEGTEAEGREAEGRGAEREEGRGWEAGETAVAEGRAEVERVG